MTMEINKELLESILSKAETSESPVFILIYMQGIHNNHNLCYGLA